MSSPGHRQKENKNLKTITTSGNPRKSTSSLSPQTLSVSHHHHQQDQQENNPRKRTTISYKKTEKTEKNGRKTSENNRLVFKTSIQFQDRIPSV